MNAASGKHGDSSLNGHGWLLIEYEPVSLFSLRMTHATNKGGKTLLVPTPYAVKLTLIDACFRAWPPELAEEKARRLFNAVKGQRIHFRPPRECIVQNTFVKIRQPERGAPAGIYAPTIAYREWCYYHGELTVAISTKGISQESLQIVRHAARHVNCFGKRGCFWQFRGFNDVDSLPHGFTVDRNDFDSLDLEVYGISQFLDDFGEPLCRVKNGFDRISTYDDAKIKLGQHRVLRPTLIPYRRIRASRNFTQYRRETSA